MGNVGAKAAAAAAGGAAGDGPGAAAEAGAPGARQPAKPADWPNTKPHLKSRDQGYRSAGALPGRFGSSQRCWGVPGGH